MFGYFQLQAAAVVLFSLPFLAVMQNPRPPFSLWELAGVIVWMVGIVGESLADRQLAGFRAKPWNHDRVCRDGLWFFSRHPNYFFEWVHWWAYVVMAIGSPGWWLTWIGPVVMGVALIRITGIPWAEEQAIQNSRRRLSPLSGNHERLHSLVAEDGSVLLRAVQKLIEPALGSFIDLRHFPSGRLPVRPAHRRHVHDHVFVDLVIR